MNNPTSAILLLLLAFITACKPGTVEEKKQLSGELDFRIEKIVTRITQGELPRITKDFLLAGLTLDPGFERRFTNYSGDQTGRYLSAMIQVDTTKQTINIHDLVNAIMANQKEDGRFGADSLSFEAKDIEGAQMALLWGNGRLLNGLMDYHARYPCKKQVLASAQKLGDFLAGVTDACTMPEIIARFKTMGAMGYICFTQITEGMVKLYNATGKEKYKKVAETAYPLLPELGNQHSHGYLNTLRGVVMLYEATKDPKHLEYVENKVAEIFDSENCLITGGVPEFFSFHGSAEGIRDEGCSEADLFMLYLQLWKATGNDKYLDKGEYLFMNHMLYNQFLSGDFGHHVIKQGFGFITAPMPGQSWWCCDYHGLQALHEAKKMIVTTDGKYRKINLFYPVDWKDDQLSFSMQKTMTALPSFQISVHSAADEALRLAIRNPYWSSSTTITVNGKPVEATLEKGYRILDNPLKNGDIINIILQPVLKLMNQEKYEIDLTSVAEKPVEAAMIYGPWLMSADDVFQNLFMAEPAENNIIYIPADLTIHHVPAENIPRDSYNPEAYLSFSFLKEGTSQTGHVILRPLSEVSFQSPSNVRHWFKFVVTQTGKPPRSAF
jgi:DUF1680 family protein